MAMLGRGHERAIGSALLWVIVLLALASSLRAAVPRPEGRLDRLALPDPGASTGPETVPLGSLRVPESARAAWDEFLREHGTGWRVWLDGRSGVPTLVEGPGIPWVPGNGDSLASIEGSLRAFVDHHAAALRIATDELVLSAGASGQPTPDLWQVVFDRRVRGIPVPGDRLVFYVGHGNLVAFGASRFAPVIDSAEPEVPRASALSGLLAWMGVSPADGTQILNEGQLVYAAAPSSQTDRESYDGPFGLGYAYRLAWRFVVRLAGEPGTWVGLVDARHGTVLSFYDDDRYARVLGGVYPESDDGVCPSGCERADLPMPYADVSVGGSSQTAGPTGTFTCSPDLTTAVTTLAGPYVRIADTCGPVSETVTCDRDLDLLTHEGTNCAIPPTSRGGNTHAARTAYYHANRVAEKARAYLPNVNWLSQQLVVNVNQSGTCNASYDGQLHFLKWGPSSNEQYVCNNTGEIAGIVAHEWAHGLDQNDGGGYDNPSEGYADVVEILEDHTSCIGRGFTVARNCTGYGDACLQCTGLREMDWDRRQSHTPATPAGFVTSRCGTGGSGPCGRQVHCEGHVVAETIWDLAVRDLPSSGMDAASAWLLAQRLFYESRDGSGGNAYNCSLPTSNGCGVNNWFVRMRVVDDDDGNLANGTPHGAALFAAFDRHRIACGSAADPSNQSTSTCPALAAAVATVVPGTSSASLSWAAVPGAASYVVLRNDLGCDHGFTPVAATPSTSYTDAPLGEGVAYHYRVQPVGANTACEGPVSSCLSVTPEPLAGRVRFERPRATCSSAIELVVRDANIATATTSVTVRSSTEPGAETVTLTQVDPGSAEYRGTIPATTDAPAADGRLSVSHGDTLTVRYVDADDGAGGSGAAREALATVDCVGPAIWDVHVTENLGNAVTIAWRTDEPADSAVTWGGSTPPGILKSDAYRETIHRVSLSGLTGCATYWFQVQSRDEAGNLSTDDNGGSYFKFESWESFGAGLQPCHAGQVAFDRPVYGCSDSIYPTVIDVDLNRDPSAIETTVLEMTSSTETRPEPIVLTETAPNSGRFAGMIAVAPAPAIADGVLQVADGDLVTGTYRDADDGTGAAAVAHATTDLPIDCAGPTITGVRADDESAGRVRISWVTDEPANSRVDWGPTSALGTTVLDNALVTDHQLVITGLDLCGDYFFRVRSEDERGFGSVDDRGGLLYRFDAADVPGRVFFDGFEGTSAWTLEGEWQTGAGQALGSNFSDPWGAWSGTAVLGTDLSGQGAYPGNYEPSVSIQATSPAFSATSLANGRLLFRRWLNVAASPGDRARVLVKVGGKTNVAWTNTTQPLTESAWSAQEIDIASFADGKNSVRIAFELTSDSTDQRSGWNVDDVIVKSGSTPNLAPCGGCTARPSFAGLASANDADACADSGIILSWGPAASWGSGAPGTYAVYRDVTPGFTPSAANRIAAGLTGTTFSDGAAPNGVLLHYLVRAENGETCSTGPNNGGMQDDNAAYRSIEDTTSWPPPPGLGSSLRLDAVAGAHVRLTWTPVSGAAFYRVYRGNDVDLSPAFVADVDGTTYEDSGEMAVRTPRYYVVRAVDACGREGS